MIEADARGPNPRAASVRVREAMRENNTAQLTGPITRSDSRVSNLQREKIHP